MTQILHSKLPCKDEETDFDSSASSFGQNDGFVSEEDEDFVNPKSPFIVSRSSWGGDVGPGCFEGSVRDRKEERNRDQFPVLDILVAALRKSLITCSVDREDICSMDISWPTNVRHIAHVTFDRFNGFLGLPREFEPELPKRVPSASASVFGVSPESMQCSYDARGNSVPTILLLIQRRLYSQGGLQAEGIFRINAENGQEDYVRNQLSKGIVPHGIDLHCLAGLIKAWFRELPSGVLDSLTPEQVMHCNTEAECLQLVHSLPPTEGALLNWAINLMADVVQHEHQNKMNARNIAMVFAPNMTQMADPLTALIHAVQVMNFLKMLIVMTLRERDETARDPKLCSLCSDSPNTEGHSCVQNGSSLGKFLQVKHSRSSSAREDSFRSFQEQDEVDGEEEFVRSGSSPVEGKVGSTERGSLDGFTGGDIEGLFDRMSLRKGVKKLCRHPVFQLGKLSKKPREVQIVNSRIEGEEVWAA
ncbi:hypothetical protein AMTRI_Chr09g39080 [Amborella trichopoda]|uniref:Rho-GAP domain-containing protein n=1 Tax=Amborella trichopoda TaxID=13333 RepID=W1PL31_AMBTC|nr:rho GTPase-activating protein 5 [Amborella trichopoda]ERN10697.1 hypothetical protein AMTR_s00027p00028490 [Amborella trichopoda]|eukprot:XP_006849116.1 rho GTPase-activating protein 5 [Amborella trichopoda]